MPLSSAVPSPLTPATAVLNNSRHTNSVLPEARAVHFSILPWGFLWSQRDLTQPLCQGSLEGWGSYCHLQCPQLTGNRILWIKAPAWHPSDEQFWGTFYRVPQRILSRIDPWLPGSLMNSILLLAFLSLSHSPCLPTLLPGIHLPKKLPTAKFMF